MLLHHVEKEHLSLPQSQSSNLIQCQRKYEGEPTLDEASHVKGLILSGYKAPYCSVKYKFTRLEAGMR
jgi:hypothetical protein